MSLDVELGERKLNGTSSRKDASSVLGDRKVVMLVQDLDKKTGKLIPVDTGILDRNMFSNLLTARRKAELEPFNSLKLELEEEQFVIIVNEESKMLSVLHDTIKAHATHPLQQVLQMIEMIDKYQAQSVLIKELKKILFGWTTDLIYKNNEFWNSLRDNFNHSFMRRRFRLELPKNQTEDSKKLIVEAEKRVRENEAKRDVFEPKADEYQLVSEEEKQYADICDKKFKEAERNSDVEKAINDLIQKLIEWEEYGIVIHIWSVLASSFEHYHLALNPVILEAIIPKDKDSIVEQMYPFLMYLMYREECCVKRGVTPNHRFVTTLKAWSQTGFKHRGQYVSPIPYNGPAIGSSQGAMLRSFSDFKAILNKLTMNVLTDFKTPGYVATGGLISLCAIRTLKEIGRYNDRDDDVQRMLDIAYAGTDLDIAIFAQDEKEYLQKISVLEDHINRNLSQPDSKTCLKFEPKHNAPGRFRLTLPNNVPIEVFRVKDGRNSMSLVYNFHVPCVRMAYDFTQDDVFMLPSALHAGLTGVCLDVKYFASSSSPMQIVKKYISRGFSFILNRYESEMLGGPLLWIGQFPRVSRYPHACLKANLWTCFIKRANSEQRSVTEMIWWAVPPEIPSINASNILIKPHKVCMRCGKKTRLYGSYCYTCKRYLPNFTNTVTLDIKFFNLSNILKQCGYHMFNGKVCEQVCSQGDDKCHLHMGTTAFGGAPAILTPPTVVTANLP